MSIILYNLNDFIHYKPISPYSTESKEAKINEKHTLNHINNIHYINKPFRKYLIFIHKLINYLLTYIN